MSEAYCKWPAIVGIIIGCVIVISVIWCCARCLCCGAECCCGCLSCFNSCCPSPRRKNQGYQQPPPQPYGQYQSPQPPMYGSGGYGYRGPQTATFDVTSKKNKNGMVDEDALPAMPAWDHAQNKHVEEDDVAMENLNHQSAQQESLLPQNNGRYYNQDTSSQAGDLGAMQASPYHNYDQHQQFVAPSPVSTAPNSMYPPIYHTRPASSVYDPPSANPYAASIPPSYRTAPSVIASPPPQHAAMGGVGRKPVQGTWRDV